ncbi:hypothetical protein DFJ74DRAFT_739465, partial [Hyaloraphidium curvatum]
PPKHRSPRPRIPHGARRALRLRHQRRVRSPRGRGTGLCGAQRHPRRPPPGRRCVRRRPPPARPGARCRDAPGYQAPAGVRHGCLGDPPSVARAGRAGAAVRAREGGAAAHGGGGVERGAGGASGREGGGAGEGGSRRREGRDGGGVGGAVQALSAAGWGGGAPLLRRRSGGMLCEGLLGRSDAWDTTASPARARRMPSEKQPPIPAVAAPPKKQPYAAL